MSNDWKWFDSLLQTFLVAMFILVTIKDVIRIEPDKLGEEHVAVSLGVDGAIVL